MNLAGHDIGVCSWSLKPKDSADLVAMIKQLNLWHVQLALGPLIGLDLTERNAQIDQIRSAGIVITAGMISFPGEDYSTITRIRQTGGYVPDDLWPERRERTAIAAGICKDHGIKMLSAHAGFIPPSSGDTYTKMVERLSEVAALLEKGGVSLVMETGQESASELLQFLNDVKSRNVFVNFDPANMLLYGAGDPIEAISILGRHIRHVHVKDAKESDQPGVTWGAEVPFGSGEVPVADFLTALQQARYQGPLVIEREAGTTRAKDVQFATETLKSAFAALP